MRYFLVPLLILISAKTLLSQSNLVYNGNFEEKLSTNINSGEIFKAKYWNNPTNATPDYLNMIASLLVRIPKNSTGYQIAHSDSGYAGIGAYGYSPVDSTSREYIQGTIKQPLNENNSYFYTMFISLADIPFHFSYYVAINKIGVYFSQNQIFFATNGTLPFTPQIIADTSLFYSDTLNWMKISGIYKASGGEQYLTIGNFSDNKHTDTMRIVKSNVLPIQLYISYYYIDDVSLFEITEPRAIADTTICLGDSLIIGANDTAIACNWYPATGISDTSLTNPKASPKQSAWYYVSHYNSFGYLAKDSVYITVINCSNESSLMLPNIISPNNDGINDVFTAKSSNLVSFKCQLINRWGVLVAELSEPNQSWSGTTKSGVALPEGVYYYVVTAKGKDDKEYNLKGFVSLVR
ncbi:MAG TPA: gliding motility-associated C-terminal domain-containing protein [Bacteroidia bacterium]|nr:gliding motility-associated C-terminal domain-containing protein [Bacteroidia bacterium]HRH08584.1 gliding motility-associated C-terminal domain-containing protein [Bacteroidia bacterium]